MMPEMAVAILTLTSLVKYLRNYYYYHFLIKDFMVHRNSLYICYFHPSYLTSAMDRCLLLLSFVHLLLLLFCRNKVTQHTIDSTRRVDARVRTQTADTHERTFTALIQFTKIAATNGQLIKFTQF